MLFLWFDRFFTRLFPLSLFGLVLFLFLPSYSDVMMLSILLCAGLWGVYDLARGIELDAEYKDTLVKDRIEVVFDDE